jgi:hypothetical protein
MLIAYWSCWSDYGKLLLISRCFHLGRAVELARFTYTVTDPAEYAIEPNIPIEKRKKLVTRLLKNKQIWQQENIKREWNRKTQRTTTFFGKLRHGPRLDRVLDEKDSLLVKIGNYEYGKPDGPHYFYSCNLPTWGQCTCAQFFSDGMVQTKIDQYRDVFLIKGASVMNQTAIICKTWYMSSRPIRFELRCVFSETKTYGATSYPDVSLDDPDLETKTVLIGRGQYDANKNRHGKWIQYSVDGKTHDSPKRHYVVKYSHGYEAASRNVLKGKIYRRPPSHLKQWDVPTKQ